MSAKTITVKIADREYTVERVTSAKSKAWRTKWKPRVEEVLGVVAGTVGMGLNEMAAIGAVINLVRTVSMDAIDTLADMAFDYSPALAADRDHILEHCYDDELLEVAFKVLGLAFPTEKVSGLMGGLNTQAIGRN